VGAEALWPLIKGAAIVAVVLGAIAMIFRQIRKRGQAERDRDHALEEGDRNAEADEIMAEPRVDAGTWSDGLHNDADVD
jgi:hypothetical protein